MLKVQGMIPFFEMKAFPQIGTGFEIQRFHVSLQSKEFLQPVFQVYAVSLVQIRHLNGSPKELMTDCSYTPIYKSSSKEVQTREA